MKISQSHSMENRRLSLWGFLVVLSFAFILFLSPFSTRSVFSQEDSQLASSIPGKVSSSLSIPPYVPLEVSSREKQISKTVQISLNSSHLSKKPTNETLSERAFDLYMKTLDSSKVYFYQSDIDEFSKKRKQIGSMVSSGEISFAFDVFNRYLQRIDERIGTVIGILDHPINLNEDDEIIVDHELLDFPKTPEEARARWVKRIKYDLLALKFSETVKAKEKAEKEAKKTGEETGEEVAVSESDYLKEIPDDETLKKRLKRKYIFYSKRMHQTNNDDLLEMFLTAVANAYDPHSAYMSPTSYENFLIGMRLNLDGIGATLQSIDGFTVVHKLVPGGAAFKDGQLKAEDRIVAVGQSTNGEMVDVYDMKLNDVVKKVRGARGTKVRLEIVSRENADKYAEYKEEGKEKPPTNIITITREKIQLDDQAAKSQVFECGTKADGNPYKIGVIDLPAFYLDMEARRRGDPNYRSTTRDIQNILRKFVAESVDAVILDLRYNGGGSLPEVVSTVGLFIDRGTVVMTKDMGPRVNYLDDRDPGIEWTGPLVVAINKFSASASEIFAGAIKDYKRGLIIGDSTTHGKGSVQDLKDFSEVLFSGNFNSSKYGALKLTVSGFYLPGGSSPQLDGVSSDVELPSLVNHLEDISESDLDYPLSFEKIPASKQFPNFPYVSSEIVQDVREKSAQRVKDNPEFQKVLKNIQYYLDFKAKKTQTLNEMKFFEENERLRAEREEFKKLNEVESGDERVEGIERTFYLDEVMNSTVDYMDSMKAHKVEFPKEKSIKSGGGPLHFLFGA